MEIMTLDNAAEIVAENTENKKKKVSAKPARARTPMTIKDAAAALLLSMAVSFAVFILAPLYIIADNRIDFPVKFSDMMIPMLKAGAADFMALGGVLLLMRRFLPRVYSVFSRIIAGFLLAFFVQAVFLNSRETVMSGAKARYTDLSFSVISNFIIYLLIVFLPLIFHIIAKKRPVNKGLAAADRNTVFCIAAAALAVQLGWAGIKAAKTDFSKDNERYYGYLSYEQAMSLSEDENIVVFLTDRLDSLWMDGMLERYPDIADKFSGFTFYQNNVAHNTNTFPSVPQMLTGKLYDGCEWPEYMRKAWDDDSLPAILKQNGYDINIIPDGRTSVGPLRMYDGVFDNVNYFDEDNIKINYTGEYGVIHSLTKLSLAKMLPYFCKGSIAGGLGAYVGWQFYKIDEEPDDFVRLAMKPETDLRFYDYMKSNGLRADHENKTFSFIHLSASHDLSPGVASLYEPVGEKPDVYQTTRGDFEVLFEYFDELKKLGIYDKTTIVILGDHGRAPDETDGVFHTKLDSAITTALLIKPAGAEEAPIALDRWSELSNDYFKASILEMAGIDHSAYGYSYNDIIENDIHIDRYLQSVKFMNYGSLKYTANYRITGDARDFDNWEILPEHENE